MKVLVTDALAPRALERLREAGHEVIEASGLQGAALVAALDGVQALIVRGATRVTGEVLRGARSLKVVVRAGTGLDNIDQSAARHQGIAVFNTPHANAVSVAELVFGLALAFERHLAPASTDLRAGRWEKAKFSGRELSGHRIGLVGFGRIGREVALRARAFELEVWANDPLLPHWPLGFEWVRRATLDELLGACDYVSLHVPLSPDTRGLIGAPELTAMRRDAVLVNCARGGLVDEAALLAALEAGALRGALLDTFANEPPGASALLALPNVLATPHLGASTDEAQRRAGEEAAAVVIEALGD
jgi:D-3-phosphoglycerate dehydrogenase